MLLVSVLVMIIVLVAMIIDLISGIYKSKLRGEFTRSELLKRSGYKFFLYEGTLLIATCIDTLIHFTHFYEVIGIGVMANIPLFAILVGIFWCAVEFLSVREKADEKTHSQLAKVEKVAGMMLSRDEIIDALYEALRKEGVNGGKDNGNK